MGKHASLAIKMHAGRRFNSEGAVSGTGHRSQSEPFKTGGIRTKKWNPWRASLEETVGQFFQELLKLSLPKTWKSRRNKKKSVNKKAHLKIACSWPSCIPHHHPQVHEEEFECFEQKIVAKHVRANFLTGQSSGSHSKKDPRMVMLQLGLFLGQRYIVREQSGLEPDQKPLSHCSGRSQ